MGVLLAIKMFLLRLHSDFVRRFAMLSWQYTVCNACVGNACVTSKKEERVR